MPPIYSPQLRTLAYFIQEASTRFLDNTSNLITPQLLREYVADLSFSLQEGVVTKIADTDTDTYVDVEETTDSDTVIIVSESQRIANLRKGSGAWLEGTLGVESNIAFQFLDREIKAVQNESDLLRVVGAISGPEVTLGDTSQTHMYVNTGSKSVFMGRTTGGAGSLLLDLDSGGNAGQNLFSGDFTTMLFGDLSNLEEGQRFQLYSSGGVSRLAITAQAVTFQSLETAASTTRVLGYDPATARVYSVPMPSGGGGSGDGTRISNVAGNVWVDTADTPNTLNMFTPILDIQATRVTIGDRGVSDGMYMTITESIDFWNFSGGPANLMSIGGGGTTWSVPRVPDQESNTQYDRVLISDSSGNVGHITLATAYDNTFLTPGDISNLGTNGNWNTDGRYTGPAITDPGGITRAFLNSTQYTYEFDGVNWWRTVRVQGAGGGASGDRIEESPTGAFVETGTVVANKITGGANAIDWQAAVYRAGDISGNLNGTFIELDSSLRVKNGASTYATIGNGIIQVPNIPDQSGDSNYNLALVMDSTGRFGTVPISDTYDNSFLSAPDEALLKDGANWNADGRFTGSLSANPDGITRVFVTGSEYTFEFDGTNWWRTARVQGAGGGTGFYSSNGALTSPRTVNLSTNALSFSGQLNEQFTVNTLNGAGNIGLLRVQGSQIQLRSDNGNTADYTQVLLDGNALTISNIDSGNGFNLSTSTTSFGINVGDGTDTVGVQVDNAFSTQLHLYLKTYGVSQGTAQVGHFLQLLDANGRVGFAAGGGGSSAINDLAEIEYNLANEQITMGNRVLDTTSPTTNNILSIGVGGVGSGATGFNQSNDGVILMGHKIGADSDDPNLLFSNGDTIVMGDAALGNSYGSALFRSVVIGSHAASNSTGDSTVVMGFEAASGAGSVDGSVIMGFRAAKGETTLDLTNVIYLGNQTQALYYNYTSGVLRLINTNQMPSYADNAAAVAGGLAVGSFYRNGDAVQIVHS